MRSLKMQFFICLVAFISFVFMHSISAQDELPNGFEVSVQANQSKVVLGDVIQVDITVKYPPQYMPHVDEWLKLIQNSSDASGFDVISSNIDSKKPQQCTATFTLTPNRTGNLIWSSGVLKFSTKSEKNPSTISILIDPIQIVCPKSTLADVLFAPLLPLYPSKEISIDALLKKITFDDDSYLNKQQEINVARFEAYKKAWAIAVIVFLSMAVMAIVMWIMIQYDLLAKRVENNTVQVDLLANAKRLCYGKTRSVEQQWDNLLYLLQVAVGKLLGENLEVKNTIELKKVIQASQYLSEDEKMMLTSIISTLDDALYAGKRLNDTECEGATLELLQWVENRVG